MDPFTIGLIGSALSGLIGGVGQGLSTQTRQSYGGAAPSLLGSASGHLNDLWSALSAQANRGISLPDAKVGAVPTFAGGGLPMPIGLLQSGGSSGDGGFSLPGLGVSGSSAGGSGMGPGGTAGAQGGGYGSGTSGGPAPGYGVGFGGSGDPTRNQYGIPGGSGGGFPSGNYPSDPYLLGSPSLGNATGPHGSVGPGMDQYYNCYGGTNPSGFFSGNPGNAFSGGDVAGSGGDQSYDGAGRKPKAYGLSRVTLAGTPSSQASPDDLAQVSAALKILGSRY